MTSTSVFRRVVVRTRTLFLAASLALSALCLQSGCGTVQATSAGEMTPFAGAHLDVWVYRQFPGERVLALIDYPFSLAADMVLLPFTLPSAVAGDSGY